MDGTMPDDGVRVRAGGGVGGRMRTLRSLDALPACSSSSAVRYSVGIGGMERGPEVSVGFRFLGSGDGRSEFSGSGAGQGGAGGRWTHQGWQRSRRRRWRRRDRRRQRGSVGWRGYRGARRSDPGSRKVAVGGGHTNLFPEPPRDERRARRRAHRMLGAETLRVDDIYHRCIRLSGS